MPYIVDFAQIDEEDTSLVGLEGTKLGRMASLGLPIPTGFVISSLFFDEFLITNNLPSKIKKLMQETHLIDPFDLLLLSRKIEGELDKTQIPKGLKGKIGQAWRKHFKGTQPPFVVYSSIVDEGERNKVDPFHPYLIFSVKELLVALKKCWKSQFEPSQLSTYKEEGGGFLPPKIAVVVQKKVFGEISGTVNTFNPETKNTCLIYAVWGLYDESLFEENFGFDLYTVDMRNWEIIDKKIERQEKQLVRVGERIGELPISLSAKSIQKLSDKHLKSLAKLASQVVKNYFFPQVIKWAIKKNKVFVLDLGPQPIEIEPKISVQVSCQLKEASISLDDSRNIEGKTATKILFQLGGKEEFDPLQKNLGDGFILSPSNSFGRSNLLWSDICPKLKSISQEIDPNFLFFHFPDSFFEFFDPESIQNTLGGFNGNFALIFPAPLWSEKLKGLTQGFEIPVWVSCRNYQDLLFLEQYILWGAKGVLVILENEVFFKGLKLEEEDNSQQMLDMITKTAGKHQIGTGLALGKEFLSFNHLRQAVFSGFSFVAIPKNSYRWSQEELRLAEKELVARQHG